jgi:hypothetical protein
VPLAHTTCGGDQNFVQADLVEVNQVKVRRQIVRTWSNTHRDSARFLKTPAASKTGRPAAPQVIRLLSTSLAMRSAQGHEQDWNEVPPRPTE